MKISLSFLFLFWIAITEIAAQTESHVRIKSSRGEILSGVYMLNKTQHYLVTSSSEEGVCYFDIDKLLPTDSIQFSSIGFLDKIITAKELATLQEILLSEKTYLLQEVEVSQIRPEALLKKATNLLKKQKGKPYQYRYYGKGQYMKITQCNHQAVEYRREYGIFFTSGNVTRQGKWDKHYYFDFIPAYIARSYNMTADSQDTLYPLRLYNNNLYKMDRDYDAGNIKIQNLIRAVLLDGPVFSELKNYRFHLIDNNRNYTYKFRSIPTLSLEDLRISCNGTLTIDPQTARLQELTLDYIDYHMENLRNWTRKIACPYSTRAKIEIGWNKEDQPYIKSCIQETIWKNSCKFTHSDSTTFLGNTPSRRSPAKNKLIEQEAFITDSYNPYPEVYGPLYYSAITRASRINCGEYNPEFFDSLIEPLESFRAKTDLNKFMDIEKQFRFHDNRPYYDASYYSNHFDILNKAFGDITTEQYAFILETYRQRVIGVFLKGENPETILAPVHIPE